MLLVCDSKSTVQFLFIRPVFLESLKNIEILTTEILGVVVAAFSTPIAYFGSSGTTNSPVVQGFILQ